MPTPLPVLAPHMIEGFEKGISRDSGPYYRVIYKIDNWSDTDAFVNALMGYATASGPVGGITVTRGVPHAHPLSPNLYCHAAAMIEGLGQPILNANGYPDYDGGALIRADYAPPPFDFAGNPNQGIDPGTPLTWCTQDVSYTTESHTVPSATTVPASIPAVLTISLSVLTLTFHKLPYMPMTAVRALIGRVNTTPFLGAGAGLVLFKGGDLHREWNTDGSVVQEVKLVFHERPAAYPWNSGPTRANPYTWEPVSDSNGNKPNQTGDLNALLF